MIQEPISLQNELQQRRPFGSRGQEAVIALLRTADLLRRHLSQASEPHGITVQQYNVLRILRGAGPQGLACRGIGERLISHDPDITRLLDRMEKRGLITRERQKDDRRVVKTRITPQGIELIKPLDQPMRDLHKRQFRHVPATRLKILSGILEEIRAREQE